MARESAATVSVGVALNMPPVTGGSGALSIRSTVIPPPGPGGVLPASGGRRQRVGDPVALAARINGQSVGVRIDFDHQTEAVSPTFSGSTAAVGWVSDFRAMPSGSIAALLKLSDEAAATVRQGKYRYLSPALLLSGSRSSPAEVIGMSSLALVNSPNLQLPIGSLHGAEGPNVADLRRREDALEERERNYAHAIIDDAIKDGRLQKGARLWAWASIRDHDHGMGAGIAAFEAAFMAPPATQLQHFRLPEGYVVTRQGAALHARVLQVAQSLGVSYRDAADAVAAERTPADFARRLPEGYVVTRQGAALHARVLQVAQPLGVSYRDAVLEVGGGRQ